MLVQCPDCSRQITVTPRLSGRKVKCQCGTLMRMPELEGAPAAPSSAPTAAPTPPPATTPSAVPAAADIQFDCPTCNQRLSVPANAAGQVTQCPCGTQLQIPHAAPTSADPFALPNELPSPGLQPLDNLEEVGLEPINDPYTPMPGPPPLQDPFAPAPDQTGNPYGASSTPAYLQPSKPGGKRKVKRKVRPRESDSSSSGFAINGQIMSGLGMMALAAIWFIAGLAAGWIYFYPPILFIIGLVTMVRGFFDPD